MVVQKKSEVVTVFDEKIDPKRRRSITTVKPKVLDLKPDEESSKFPTPLRIRTHTREDISPQELEEIEALKREGFTPLHIFQGEKFGPGLREKLQRQTSNELFWTARHLGLSDKRAKEFVGKILTNMKYAPNIKTVETRNYDVISEFGMEDALNEGLKGRSDLIISQITPFLGQEKEKVGIQRKLRALDAGCGDGEVGLGIQKMGGFQVDLCDVRDYRTKEVKDADLPFQKTKEGERIPYQDGEFDIVNGMLVLHHSQDPDFLLNEWTRVLKPGGFLILNESVLKTLESFPVQAFQDWFYNRCFHDPKKANVPVPFNFRPASKWMEDLKNRGLELVADTDLGKDMDIVQEQHHQLIFRKAA
ncbi:class I SAM-dependent methyltransferase [Candidatus Altiarchaeota archaeon]